MDRFRNILYLERHLEGSSRAFSSAALLAGVNRAHLSIAAVVDGDEDRWRGRVDNLAARAAASGVDVHTKLLDGDPRARLLDEVRGGRHDLLMTVAGTPPPPSLAAAHPLDRALLRSLPCATWLLAPQQSGHIKAIVGAVSLEEDAPSRIDRRIVEVVTSLARRTGARFHLAHFFGSLGEAVLPGPLRGLTTTFRSSSEDDAVREREERMRTLLDSVAPESEPNLVLERGDAFRGVTHLARETEADVVVVGNAARTGFGGLLFGNLTERLLGRVHGSVLALRHGDVPASHLPADARWAPDALTARDDEGGEGDTGTSWMMESGAG